MSRSWWQRPIRERMAVAAGRRVPRGGAAQALESLEDRTLLSVDISVSGHTVTFTGGETTSDNLYLQTDAGDLQYSTDGTNFTSDLGSGQTLALNADTTIDVHVGGTLHVRALTTVGKAALTIDATNPVGGNRNLDSANVVLTSPVEVEGNILTSGGDLTIYGYKTIEVQPNIVVSTRQISGSDALQGASTGNSGNLTVTTRNPDRFNPLLNVGFNNPAITIDAGAKLLAQADGNFTAGTVSFTATNTNYSISSLFYDVFAAVSRDAAISIGDGAVVEGGAVTINATSGDVNALNLLASLDGQDGKSWGPWVSGLVQNIAQLPTDFLSLPVSVMYKQAKATVNLASNVQITGSGDVSVQSQATADATSEAIYRFATNGAARASPSAGPTRTAQTEIASGAKINTGGNITFGSLAQSTGSGTARVTQNLGQAATQLDNIQLSGAVAVVKTTSHATVDQGRDHPRRQGGRHLRRRQEQE